MTSAVAEIQTLFHSTQLRTIKSLKVPCTWESTNPTAKTWYLAKLYPFHPSRIQKVACKPAPNTSYWRHSKRKSGSLKAVMYEVTDVTSVFTKSKQAKGNAADSPSRLPQSSVPAEVGRLAVPLQGIVSSQVGIMASWSDHGHRGTKSLLSPAHHAEPRQRPAFSRLVCSCQKGFAVWQGVYWMSSPPVRGGFVLLESWPFPCCFGSHSQKKSKKPTYITKTFKPTCVLPLHPQ